MDGISKAVVSVLGFDRRGIIARVSMTLFECGVNILDISQTIVAGYFNMVMVVDMTGCNFAAADEKLQQLGEELGVQIRMQRSEIFEAMHQI